MIAIKNNLLRPIFVFALLFSMIQFDYAQPILHWRPKAKIEIQKMKLPEMVVDESACSADKLAEIVSPATANKSRVFIDCNVKLRPNDVVTKRMVFEGSKATGVICDCNGAKINGGKNTINEGADMIEVKSKKINNRWIPARSITIKNCNVIGSVRIWGMGKNGEWDDVKASSREDANNSNHIGRIRGNAPSYIRLDRMTITGTGRNPLYFAPGVTHCSLTNSEMKGKSSKVGIYFDAESAHNLLANNYIHVKTDDDDWGRIPGVTNRGWPQVALDGSSHNRIFNNRFSALNNGGIYFYRNCGEGGTIRHNPPEHNVIVNNSFYYKKYAGTKPTIFLSSRDYGRKERLLGHCDADDGRPYGSSKSEKDYARNNIIMQNQFYKRKIWKNTPNGMRKVNATVADMIRTKNFKVNSPNYIEYNELVGKDIQRKAGCFVKDGYKNFLLHGESIDVYKRGKGLQVTGLKRTCNDGELITTAVTNREIKQIPFECQVEGSNGGCRRNTSCPSGYKIVGVKVACNLEFGLVMDSSLEDLEINKIKVVRSSDRTSDGLCYLGSNKIRSGDKALIDFLDEMQVVAGCKEKDKNGGDCHVKGILFCRVN